MRIVIVSDTHCFEPELPDGDMLIHCGDLTNQGTFAEVAQGAAWLEKQPHATKCFVAGNHDWLFQINPKLAQHLMEDKGITVLQDTLWEVNGLRVYGTSWQPFFMGWAFNVESHDQLAQRYASIPTKLDVLITHCPPYDVLDRSNERSQPLGSPELLDRVCVVQPKIHCFGHIHGGAGTLQHAQLPTRFVNAATCNERYEPVNPPTVIDL